MSYPVQNIPSIAYLEHNSVPQIPDSVVGVDVAGPKYSEIAENTSSSAGAEFIALNGHEFGAIPSSTGKTQMPTIRTPSKPRPVRQPVRSKQSDYIFQFYVGSLSVVGLLCLFRFIQKS